MNRFFCEQCGAEIRDMSKGYETGCLHYPLETRRRIHMAAHRNNRPDQRRDIDAEEETEWQSAT